MPQVVGLSRNIRRNSFCNMMHKFYPPYMQEVLKMGNNYPNFRCKWLVGKSDWFLVTILISNSHQLNTRIKAWHGTCSVGQSNAEPEINSIYGSFIKICNDERQEEQNEKIGFSYSSNRRCPDLWFRSGLRAKCSTRVPSERLVLSL